MKTYTIDEMKRAFECGRNFQLTGENNFQELIEELNQALRQPPVSGRSKQLVCDENELDCPYEFTSRCTMGRCDCKPKQTNCY